ncbi:MAG: hypothetical protein FWF44_05300 [Defluviitaleaceae bacterium]|nr:hypothetical protein [Defluviitaleaceae bacterium]
MAENMKLAFACKVCGEIAKPQKTVLKDFKIIAYDNMVDWLDISESVPAINERKWARALAMPSCGELRPVFVRFPFNFDIGEYFWVLFMPCWSYLNGWQEFPHEIAESAIVKCRFDSIIAQSEDCAWVNLYVAEVTPLPALCEKFPAVVCNNYLSGIKEVQPHEILEYEDWLEYSWNGEGDCGAWGLLNKYNVDSYHMVLYCEWEFHYRNVYCGNLIVDINA